MVRNKICYDGGSGGEGGDRGCGGSGGRGGVGGSSYSWTEEVNEETKHFIN